jgi:predicted alpha/beta-fold hydrolase
LAGVVSVNTPIDLAACSRRLQRPVNRIYQERFTSRMKERLLRTGRYSAQDLEGCRSVFDIDDKITAPSFGFGNAANYYETQSALRVVPYIQVPTLMIMAQDDPLVPYESYSDPALAANPCIQILSPKHGGHLGYLSRRPPRFWSDEVILSWLARYAC